jgi:methionyl-tRNA formyltransferase
MTIKKTGVIFFGAGNFAVKILQNLLKLDYLDLKAVITQPDKEAGRKKEMTPPPVKIFLQQGINLQQAGAKGADMQQARAKGADMNQADAIIKAPGLNTAFAGGDIPLLQPEKLKTAASGILEKFKPELIIVADYGQMIPPEIIDYPKYKCLNIHGSLLPKYRGAVPVAMAILQGEKTTGVSIPVMSYGLDDGPVIASRTEKILPTDTTYILRMRLADTGNNLLNEILPGWLAGKIHAIPQDESKVTFTFEKDIAKEKVQIKIDTPLDLAERMVRAFSPWPIAWLKINFMGKERRLKIYSAEIAGTGGTVGKPVESPETGDFTAGTIFKNGKEIFLSLKGGILKLIEVQLDGKKKSPGSEALFLDGSRMVE